MGIKKRHHIVSRGYQRFFGEDDRVQVLIKGSDVNKVIGTADCCVVDHFNSLMTPGGPVTILEDTWSEVEGIDIPLVRELVEFGEGTARHFQSLRSLASLHFARSFGMSAAVGSGLLAISAALAQEIATDPHTVELFRREYGRDPAGEIEQFVEEQIELMTETRWWIVNRMWHYYQLALEYLEGLHLRFVTSEPRGVGFICGDSPFVVGRYGGLHLGVENGLALHDADIIYFPLSPQLGVMFTTDPQPPVEATELQTKWFNGMVYRSSKSILFGHPAQDLRRATRVSR